MRDPAGSCPLGQQPPSTARTTRIRSHRLVKAARTPYIAPMPSFRPLLIVPILAGLSACGSPYDPPIQTDHTAAKYKTDIQACQTSSTEAVRRRNAAGPGTWIMSPIHGPSEVRAAIRSCMTAKGYKVGQTFD